MNYWSVVCKVSSIYRGFIFGSFAVEFGQILGSAAFMIHEPLTGLQAALVKLQACSHIPQEAVHLGARRGALAEAPFLAA